MYNTDLPRRADLPTSAELKRSTICAALLASVILVTVVLPSEYAIDPTGLGGKLGLTQMGEIKIRLASEAAADTAANARTSAAPTPKKETAIEADAIGDMLAPPKTARALEMPAAPVQVQALPPQQPQPVQRPAATAAMVPSWPAAEIQRPPAVSPAKGRSDQVNFTLTPGQGAEIKLVMLKGNKANYTWTANGAVVNVDVHGDGGGEAVSYEKLRGVGQGTGVLEAPFTGNHGWFWRNRTNAPVTLTLKTTGAYSEIKRVN